jgi:integrase
MGSMRRGRGEGTPEQLPSGLWRVRIRVNGRRISTQACASRQAAILAAKKLLPTAPNPSKIPTLWKYFDDRRDYELAEAWAVSTWQLCDVVARTWLFGSELGDKKIHAIEPEDVIAWRNGIRAGNAYRNRAAGLVSGLLARAIDELRLKIPNPARGIKPLPVKETVRQLVAIDERKAFLALMPPGRLLLAARLMLHGMRRGEACGCRYDDVDGDGIWVRRQIQEPNGHYYVKDLTKTGESRWVPLDEDARALIGKGSGWLLPTKTEKAYRPHNLWRDMRKALEGSKWEKSSPHALRATFDTWMLDAGVGVRTAAEISGHSPAVLAKTYARTNKAQKAQALEMLNPRPEAPREAPREKNA